MSLRRFRARGVFPTGQPTEHSRSSPTDPLRSEPAGTGADQDDVVQLREALRAAERAYRGYLVELRQGDVGPIEDWSTCRLSSVVEVR